MEFRVGIVTRKPEMSNLNYDFIRPENHGNSTLFI